MADIFISYTSSARDWVPWISNKWETLRHRPSVYQWTFGGGLVGCVHLGFNDTLRRPRGDARHHGNHLGFFTQGSLLQNPDHSDAVPQITEVPEIQHKTGHFHRPREDIMRRSLIGQQSAGHERDGNSPCSRFLSLFLRAPPAS
jgi:hypothetical protein